MHGMRLALFLCLINRALPFALVRDLKVQRFASKLALSIEPERTVVLAYNKPAGLITTHEDPLGRPTVYDDVLSMKGFKASTSESTEEKAGYSNFEAVTGIRSKLHAIGRLDADTTGLLLLTNDGGLVHHVTNKNSHSAIDQGPISKTYEALIMGFHDDKIEMIEKGSARNEGPPDALLHQLRTEGVDLGEKNGGKTLPVKHLTVIAHPTRSTTLLELTIIEGKNRQIRRMFHSLGSGVMKLKRTKIGESLTLDDMEEGDWRVLRDKEIFEALNWKVRELDFNPVVGLNRGKVLRTAPPRPRRSRSKKTKRQ